MAEWEIKKPLGVCFGTDREIEPKQEFYGALVETEEGLARRDFSVEYWDSEHPEVYCFWRGKLADADEKKQLFVDDEMLMAFFERLEKETADDKVDFRFVLALILMRKRKLKYDSGLTEDGRDIWRLRIVGQNAVVDVVNPGLSEEKIEQLSGQLGQILHAEM